MTVLIIVIIVIAVVWLFMQSPQFGSKPSGDRLKKAEASANYKNKQFQNLHHTPQLTGDASILTVTKKFFFEKDKRNKPASVLPSVKTDLHSLPPGENVLVWFGHSSYFMQLDGKKFLVDPVLSGNASPFSFTTSSFKGSDVYTVDDIPPLDFLLITHDHYDHLDFRTVTKLKEKVGKVITGLGVGAHLERWGFDETMIEELDWNESLSMSDGFTIHAAPARHFSGRGFKRNGTLWLSFVLQAPSLKIYIGGDSGYNDHFLDIGNQHGPFDLAILEAGQYNEHWKFIHMMPEEAVQAAIDLGAKALLPVHWSKFSLSLHDWDEPIRRVMQFAAKAGIPVVHPMIGEPALLRHQGSYTSWWEAID